MWHQYLLFEWIFLLSITVCSRKLQVPLMWGKCKLVLGLHLLLWQITACGSFYLLCRAVNKPQCHHIFFSWGQQPEFNLLAHALVMLPCTITHFLHLFLKRSFIIKGQGGQKMVGLSCPSATGWASSSDGVLGSVSVKTVLYGSALQYKSGGVVSLFFNFSTPDPVVGCFQGSITCSILCLQRRAYCLGSKGCARKDALNDTSLLPPPPPHV